jgi:carboxylesterase type B
VRGETPHLDHRFRGRLRGLRADGVHAFKGIPHGASTAGAKRPNYAGLPEWPAYTLDERATMLFDDVSAAVNDPGAAERQFWDDV